MSTEPRDVEDREEPPMVAALLLRSGRLAGSAARRSAGVLSARTWLRIWGLSALVGSVGVFYLVASAAPGWQGVLTGLWAAFLVLLFIGGAGAFLFMTFSSRSARPRPEEQAREAELNAELEPTLRELRRIRADIIREVKVRSRLRVPLAMVIASSVWVFAKASGDSEAPSLILLLFVGALVGEMWASHRLSKQYRRLYKDRVLPRLAARFGDLTHRRPDLEQVRKLLTFRVINEAGSISAEDEFRGTYRGLPLSIVDVRVEQQSDDGTRVLFSGLLVELELPRSLAGTTVIASDRGTLGNLAEQRHMKGLQRVRLEDPDFERRFEVYASDQVEARALLTPAFMQRFTALAAREDFSVPGAWAEGGRLVLALPARRRLFQPPPYWKPAGGRVLLELHDDIAAVLRMADSVIELDFWASGRAAAHAAPAPPAAG